MISEFPKRTDDKIEDKIAATVAIIVEKWPDKEFNLKSLKDTYFDIKSPAHVEFITKVCEKLKDLDYTIKAGKPFAKSLREQETNNSEKVYTSCIKRLRTILVRSTKHSMGNGG